MATRPATTGSKLGAAIPRPPEASRKATGASLLDLVQREHPALARAWFRHLRPGAVEGGILRVFAENAEQVRYLQQHCGEAFTAAAQAMTGRLIAVSFECLPAETSESRAAARSTPPLTDDFRPLESFVVGPSNEFAHAAIVAVGHTPGQAYNPLYLHGPPGTGKSHLLRAAARILGGEYYTATGWTNEVMASIETDQRDLLRRRFRSAPALILDDVHLLAGCEQSQEELFHSVKAMADLQRQIVVAGASSPCELPQVHDRLTSRFSAGLVAGLDSPSLETRAAILREHAGRRSIEAAPEAVRLIAENGGASAHDFLGALTRADSLARLRGLPITIDVALDAIDEGARWRQSTNGAREITCNQATIADPSTRRPA